MQKLILASASLSRQALLKGAGIDVDIHPSHVDEEILKSKARLEKWDVEKTALALSEEKGRAVSQRYPDALIIAADQMLDCQGQWFDKPIDLAAADQQLRHLRSKSHRLVSGICVLHNKQLIWSHSQSAELVMRDFSDEFLKDYINSEGEKLLTTVGGYRLEERGVQLFEKISGDYFTILGLPLLALCEFLRREGILKT